MNSARAIGPSALALVLLTWASAPGADVIAVHQAGDYFEIVTDATEARVNTKGYVSGVAGGSFLDKKTGARDLGFGLHIMDFLMAPGWREDGYTREPTVHGHLPKHYVEGPQICTRARHLRPEIVRGWDFVALKLRYTFTEPGKGYKVGSTWEQTLLFLPHARYVLSAERIVSANDVDNLFYRIDMPGHVRHKGGDTFAQVYLSYLGRPIPASEFRDDFAPDGKFLYRRRADRLPRRMIRAYQVKRDGRPGPWLAGMTLDPSAVCEAWCHQRGYVCFIEELHGRRTKAGEAIGAAYVVGWFDNVAEMERVYDRYRGVRAIVLSGNRYRLE
jgi:hypothetical protein